jgi:hypothetical protein
VPAVPVALDPPPPVGPPLVPPIPLLPALALAPPEPDSVLVLDSAHADMIKQASEAARTESVGVATR